MTTPTCTLCNHEIPADDLLEFADHLLCPDCATRYTTECQCCGERIWFADNAGSHSSGDLSLNGGSDRLDLQ